MLIKVSRFYLGCPPASISLEITATPCFIKPLLLGIGSSQPKLYPVLAAIEVAFSVISAFKSAFIMALDSSTVLQPVLLLTLNCSLVMPANRKHPTFDRIITSDALLQEIASTVSLVFAPGLFEIPQAAVPPHCELQEPAYRFFQSMGHLPALD